MLTVSLIGAGALLIGSGGFVLLVSFIGEPFGGRGLGAAGYAIGAIVVGMGLVLIYLAGRWA